MSERTEVVVEFPLAKVPSDDEMRRMLKDSFKEAKKLIGPGTVLGIVSRAIAENKETGQPVLLVKLAVTAPEALQPS